MTEPRKTPRTDAEEVICEVVCPSRFADFSRALEIETQELAEALGDMVSAYGVFSCSICETAHKALAHYRANQEVPHV